MNVMELTIAGNYKEIAKESWNAEELDRRDEDGLTALMHAAGRGDYRTIDALKKAGADLDIRDNSGLKAVDHAARNGHSSAIIYLIEGGCGG